MMLLVDFEEKAKLGSGSWNANKREHRHGTVSTQTFGEMKPKSLQNIKDYLFNPRKADCKREIALQKMRGAAEEASMRTF